MLANDDKQQAERLRRAMPHATLLVAERGLDDEAFVQMMLDDEPRDVFYVEPEKNKKTAIIRVDQIRELIFSLKTFSEHRRVVIFRRAELMNEQAQNAFLKTLEEPNRDVYFILITGAKERLLDTVVSRCQVVHLHRTSPKEDEQFLQDLSIDTDKKAQIRFLAAGRPKLFTQLATDEELFKKYQTYAQGAKYIMAHQDYETLQKITAHAKTRDDAQDFLEILFTLIRWQMSSGATNAKITALMERAVYAEKLLRANGNIKLALLQLLT